VRRNRTAGGMRRIGGLKGAAQGAGVTEIGLSGGRSVRLPRPVRENRGVRLQFHFHSQGGLSPVDNGAGGEFLPPDAQEAGA